MTRPQEKRIAREAAEWVVKFDSPDFAARDVRAFRRWIARSPEHRAAFEHASRTWHQLDLLAKLEAFPLPANDSAPRVDRRAVLIGASAGVLALGAAGYVALGAGAALAYETGVGEVREITLSDGTRVVLNAASEIEARVSHERRSARLVTGEALFIVAERTDIFEIDTPRGKISTRAGEILVKALTSSVRATLLSGAAVASSGGLFRSNASVAVDGHSEIILADAAPAEAALASDMALRRTLWREGQLAFDDTPLSEAADDVARQTGARFSFADPALADLRIGGLIDARDLDAFLLLLRTNLAINAEPSADGAILLSSMATLSSP